MKISLYDFYKKYYSLQDLKINISKKKVLLLIYDEKYNYYLDNDSFITINKFDNLLNIINEVNNSYKTEITNFYPLCFCGGTLVISCRTMICESTTLNVVSFDDVLNKKNKKLIDYHKNKDMTLYVSSNVKKEISMSRKYLYRYKFHENFIKKYFLTEEKRRKKEFKKMLFDLIPNKKSIIDVSCGDSSDMLLLAKEREYDVIVGNDICLNYLYTHNDSEIIYTNDNIEQNFIGNSVYDVSFCKNTLHHMNDVVCIKNLLDFLKRISNEIIIVEIINPIETGGLPKFLNKYLYTKFLKDVGKCFLNEDQFISIIDNKFSNCDIKYQKFKNILGEYMVAKITKK